MHNCKYCTNYFLNHNNDANGYIAKLEAADFPHQLIRSTVQEDGTVVALMRKRYNPINPFFLIESVTD